MGCEGEYRRENKAMHNSQMGMRFLSMHEQQEKRVKRNTGERNRKYDFANNTDNIVKGRRSAKGPLINVTRRPRDAEIRPNNLMQRRKT